MNLKAFAYNGQTINQRDDGYINLSQMCQANGKLLADWNRLKKTKSYIKTLSEDMGIPISQIIEVTHGNQTFGHPSVAINLARWLNDKFAVWCDAHIFNLMTTGQTSLAIDPMEEMRLKIELLRLEKDVAIAKGNTAIAEKNLLDTKQYITTALPEPVQQKILGYQLVTEKVVEKVVYKEDEFIRNDSTVNKTHLCKRYGILTKSGSPDYRRLNKILESANLPSSAWQEIKDIQTNKELKVEYLGILDKLIVDDSRQLWIAE